MKTSLDSLIFTADRSTTLRRNEVILSFDIKNHTPSDVTLDGRKQSIMDRVWSRGDRQFVVVKAGTTIEVEPLTQRCEDVASEVQFDLHLKLSLETPQEDQPDELRLLVQAFRPELMDGANEGPSAAFVSELKQWMRSTYRKSQALKDIGKTGWAQDQSATVAKHIKDKFGLTVQANLRAELVEPQSVAPSILTVVTATSDSTVPVELKVRVGCQLKAGTHPFSATRLKPEQFKAGIKRLIGVYVSKALTLQEFRFSRGWFDDLEQKIAENLAKYDRVPTGFLVETVRNEDDYDVGPFTVTADKAKFVPLGWDDADAIQFSSKAELTIIDAGKFEAASAQKKMLKTEVFLAQWLKVALQESIESSLHEIHRSDRGYAALLTGWETTYKNAIERDLARRAGEIGVAASAILAKPDCDEMGLLDGAELKLTGLKLPAFEVNADLEMDLEFDVRIEKFGDIRPILNASRAPLDHITQKVVTPALARAAKTISYVDFNLNFDSPPTDEQGSRTGISCVDRLEDACREALEKEGLQLESFRPRRRPTEHWRVFNKLISAPRDKVTITVPYFAYLGEDGTSQVSDEFEVYFMLKLTGLDEAHAGEFFGRNWNRFQGNGSLYGAVVATVEESLHTYFTANDVEVLNMGNIAGPNGRERFEILVRDYLNQFLADSFGLKGDIIAVGFKPPAPIVALSELRVLRLEQDTETRKAQIILSGELARKELEREQQTRLAISAKKAEAAVEEAKYSDDGRLSLDKLDGAEALVLKSQLASSIVSAPRLTSGDAKPPKGAASEADGDALDESDIVDVTPKPDDDD